VFNWPKDDFTGGINNKVKKVYLLSDPAKKPLILKKLT